MKYLKLFENFNQYEIDDICEKYNIKNYTINPDGSIDVDGNVELSYRNLTKLPIKFNKITGHFNLFSNNLNNLEGCPNYVGGEFDCRYNKLTNLIESPNYVGGKFNCSFNQLTNLEGCPNHIGECFNFSSNQLTSLDGCLNVGNYFNYYYTTNPISPIVDLFNSIKIYLDYQETYNFLRSDSKIVKHLLEEAIKDYNEYYNKSIITPKEIKGYTYI
jgi:hypothetical protein